jgi:hypothetical protein
MTSRRVVAIVGLGLVLAAAAALRAEQPAAAPPPDGKLVAVAKIVVGTVETRAGVGNPWTPVKEGMRLDEGADVRTGFRARCVLDMTDSLIQVDPLTVIRIGELRKDGDKVRTRVYMKQGNTQAVVEKGRIQSDFAIVTPSATLSVRGTQGIRARFFPGQGGQYGLAGPGLISVADAYLGRQTTCGQGENTNDNATPPILFLAQQFLPQILDQGGYESDEKNAAGRWHTSTPFPVGLSGAGAGPVDTNPQNPVETGGGGNGGFSAEPPVDITKPPRGGNLTGQPPVDLTKPPRT